MDKKKVLLLGTGRTFMNIFARLFLEFNVHYESPLQDGAKIFTPNHPTTSDPFLLSLVTQEPLIILVNQRVLQLPLVGSLIKHAGTIPVDKEGGNGKETISRAIDLLKDNFPIGIFLEGRLSPEVQTIADAHTGAVRIAMQAHAPIFPVGIYLHKQSVKRIRFHTRFGLDESRWIFRGKYFVTVGSPFYFHGNVENRNLVQSSTHKVAEEIRRLILSSEKRATQKNIAWKPLIPFASQNFK